MSLGRLKTRLRSLINRKDLTDALATGFVQDAISALERSLRIGPMEDVLEQADWDGERNAIILPSTFIEQISLFTDTHELVQCDLSEFLAMDNSGGVPLKFAKVAGRYLLRPTPSTGSKLYLHFYSQLPLLESDDDTNAWTEACFLAVLYASAALAADHFQMEGEQHADRYRSIASGHIEAISSQALDEAWAGRMAISAPQDIGPY